MKAVRKAVLPVAGRGTRLLPATKSIPKELLPVVDTPILQLLVEEALAAGCEEIIFVTSREKPAIQEFFESNKKLEKTLKKSGRLDELDTLRTISQQADFKFVEQKKPLGDGHAVLQAEKLVGDEPFLVLFGDEILDPPIASTLVREFETSGSATLALVEVEPTEVDRYGIVAPRQQSGLRVEVGGFVEKPTLANAPSNLAIVGKYVCPPEIFEILKDNPSGSGEIRLIDALTILLEKEPIYGVVATGERYDTGSHAGYARAFIAAALEHPEVGNDVKRWLVDYLQK